MISRISYVTIIEERGGFSIRDKDPLQVFLPSLKEAHSTLLSVLLTLRASSGTLC